jgi:GNAT superfamily N-acetyltransferase
MRVEIPEDRPRLELELADGSNVWLAPLAPEDRSYLVTGLEEMSLESRFSRFGQGRRRLSEREWDYLTNVDQRRHVAWVAVVEGRGAGVGRYILTEDDPCAEVAVTVLDEYQRRGVGTLLFQALLAVARSDGVEELCFEVLPSNRRVRKILAQVNAAMTEVDGLIEGRIVTGDLTRAPLETEVMCIMDAYRSGQS